MNLKELFTEDRGVSPVIGVILMVAITVILAAVIGAFVLGLGDQASDQPPQASVGFDFDGTNNVTISHDGGDTLENDSTSVVFQGNDISTQTWNNGDDITAGAELDLWEANESELNAESGDTVRVVWSGDSGSSNTIAQRDFP